MITASFRFLLLIASLGVAHFAWAGSATGVSGLYYTGVNNSGTTLGDGAVDSHWQVTYARVGGSSYTGNSTYTGSSYVVSNSYIDGAWVDNSSTSRWITAPGARTSAGGGSGTANQGGDFLPGNGTEGSNSAYYVYRLAFTISGTSAGWWDTNVNNNVSISLTIAADDHYAVYVNPASAVTVDSNYNIQSGGTQASASGTSAWNNTTSVTLRNYGSGSSNNADFKIGTNYLYIVVANSNSVTGTSGSNAFNPSGLLVYQVGSAITIDGKPIPEVGSFLPVAGALGLFALRRLRKKKDAPAKAA